MRSGTTIGPMIRMRTLKTPARVRTRPLPAPIRKTAAMFKPKAIAALEIRMNGPILYRCWKGAQPSVKGRMRRLIAAQT